MKICRKNEWEIDLKILENENEPFSYEIFLLLQQQETAMTEPTKSIAAVVAPINKVHWSRRRPVKVICPNLFFEHDWGNHSIRRTW